MGNFGQPNVKFMFSTASGSARIDMSQSVDTINGLELEALTQQSDAFGDSWVENLYTGIRRMSPVVVEGFYDDTVATGEHQVWGQLSHLGNERTFSIDCSGTNGAISRVCLIQKHVRSPKRGELTRYQTTLLPSGAIATTS